MHNSTSFSDKNTRSNNTFSSVLRKSPDQNIIKVKYSIPNVSLKYTKPIYISSSKKILSPFQEIKRKQSMMRFHEAVVSRLNSSVAIGLIMSLLYSIFSDYNAGLPPWSIEVFAISVVVSVVAGFLGTIIRFLER